MVKNPEQSGFFLASLGDRRSPRERNIVASYLHVLILLLNRKYDIHYSGLSTRDTWAPFSRI